MPFPKIVKCDFILPRQMWHLELPKALGDSFLSAQWKAMERSGSDDLVRSLPALSLVHIIYRMVELEESWVFILGNPLISQNWECKTLALTRTADDERTRPWIWPGGRQHSMVTGRRHHCHSQEGGEEGERLERRPSVPAARRRPGAVTLRSGQFTFGCFQSIKALCLGFGWPHPECGV